MSGGPPIWRPVTILQKAYAQYRRKYFKKLPVKAKVKWEKMPHLGYWDGEKIALNRAYRRDDKIWRFTLLHEMVHMSLEPERSHGKAFQREMLRLAKAGAFKDLW